MAAFGVGVIANEDDEEIFSPHEMHYVVTTAIRDTNIIAIQVRPLV